MIAVFTLLGVLLLPGPAWAHAVLRGTDPPMGSRLAAGPPAIRLWFDEAVVPEVSTLRLLDRVGRVVRESPLRTTDPERKTVAFELGKLEPGAYTVAWKVLSAVDGHVTRGAFAFAHVPPGFEGTVGPLGTPLRAAPGQQAWTWGLRVLQVASMWVHLVTLLAITGACVTWLLVVRPVAPAAAGPRPARPRVLIPAAVARLILRGALVSIVGGVLSLQLEWLQVSDAPWAQTFQLLLFFPAIPVALGTWSSIAAFIRLALLTGVASLATRLREPDVIALPGVLALGISSIASVAVASHAAGAGGLWWAIPDFAHLAAASLWAGGLLVLAGLGQAREGNAAGGRAGVPLAAAMRRFTPWAAGSVILLVLTGIFNGTLQVPAWPALWRTPYGGTLVAKVVLLLPLLALAALNSFWCRGRLGGSLARAWTWGERRFRRDDWAVRGEVVLAAVALLCAAALTQLPPPKEAAPAPPAPITLQGTAEGVSLAVTITSPHSLWGPSRLTVSARDARGEPPAPDARVILRPEMPDREIRVPPVAAAARGQGRYDADVFFGMQGRWDLQIVVRRPGAEDAIVPFALRLGDGGFIPVDPAAPPGTRLSLAAAWAGAATRRRLLIGAGLCLGAGMVAGLRAWRRRWAEVAVASGLAVAGGLYLWPALAVDTTPATPRRNPIVATAKSLEAGRALFEENCAVCHGAGGKPSPLELGTTLMLYAVNLDLMADHMAQHTDGDLFWWISRGIPGTPMPAYGEALSAEERWHVVNYIRSLRRPASRSR